MCEWSKWKEIDSNKATLCWANCCGLAQIYYRANMLLSSRSRIMDPRTEMNAGYPVLMRLLIDCLVQCWRCAVSAYLIKLCNALQFAACFFGWRESNIRQASLGIAPAKFDQSNSIFFKGLGAFYSLEALFINPPVPLATGRTKTQAVVPSNSIIGSSC
jgi:hypothetical protein